MKIVDLEPGMVCRGYDGSEREIIALAGRELTYRQLKRLPGSSSPKIGALRTVQPRAFAVWAEREVA